MPKQFDKFLSQLSETNATLDYFVDFDKITEKVNKISLKLNQLNYLIGKENLKQAINEIFNENPMAFDVLGILIAVRKGVKKKTINNINEIVYIESYFDNPGSIFEFIEETGLAEIFKNKNVTNLVDYVFGVEVGLDTNARKNRGGTQMENAVAKILSSDNIPFEREVSTSKIPALTSWGEDIKRFDFVIRTTKKTYLIETNYYNTGGSKLNEVARAYTDLAPKINQYENSDLLFIFTSKYLSNS